MNTIPPVATLLCARLQALSGKLLDAQNRLPAHDPEALHDLRVALRELRSLVQPVRKSLYGANELETLAAACARPTNRLRDREVLCQELARKGETDLHQTLMEMIAEDLQDLAARQPAEALVQRLLSLTVYWEKYVRPKEWRQLENCLQCARKRQSTRLKKELPDPETDLHRLRIHIKRYRYFLGSYRSLLPATSPDLLKTLKQAQELTGDWHDHHVWISEAQRLTALQPLIAAWMDESLSISIKVKDIRTELYLILQS